MADALAAREQRIGELLGRQVRRSASTFSNHSVELRAAFWIRSTSTLRTRLVVAQRAAARSPRRAGRCSAPARSRPPARAWCPSRSRSARCAPRRPSARPARRPLWCTQRAGRRRAETGSTAPSRAGARRWTSARGRPGTREQPLAEGDRLLLLHRSRPAACHTVFRRLDDEGRGVVVEAVGVRLEPAVLGLLEGEGERVEQLVRAEPDEAAAGACRCRAGRSRRTGCGCGCSGRRWR